MNLPNHIKPYPNYFKYLPISDLGFNTLLSKTIYVSKDIYADLQKPHPQPISVAVLKHQEIHAKNASVFKTLRFILFKDFRIEEERAAFKPMFHHLKKHNETFDLELVARSFSGLRYIWMTSYEDGKKLINEFWEKA